MENAENPLAAKLAELWGDEWCEWRLDYEPAFYSNSPTWRVDLDWNPESSDQKTHGADWVRWTWQFYGDTAEEALAGAVAWCEALLPFEKCGACGGEGSYYTQRDVTATCEDCGGTGLANWKREAS